MQYQILIVDVGRPLVIKHAGFALCLPITKATKKRNHEKAQPGQRQQQAQITLHESRNMGQGRGRSISMIGIFFSHSF